MLRLKETCIGLACLALSAVAIGQQVYIPQPNDGYLPGQTIFLDVEGGKYVLHMDGRTRVSPMLKIDGCDIGLKWAPISRIYYCPTYTANPDPVPPPAPTTTYNPPPAGPTPEEIAYQQYLVDLAAYQAYQAYLDSLQVAAAEAAAALTWTGGNTTPPIIPTTGFDSGLCDHNQDAYTWDTSQGGNCRNRD
jgi:hypothetical protein